MQDELKKRLGEEILPLIPEEGVVAFGSGSTVNEVIRTVGKDPDKFKDVKFLSGSSLTSTELNNAGLTEVRFMPGMEVKLCIDGADQICTEEPHHILKGRGGALLREKVLWRVSERVVVAVTEDKVVPHITGAIPIELDPFSLPHVYRMLGFFYQDFTWELRRHSTGIPFYTDGGNYIVDLHPSSGLGDPHGVNYRLKGVTGVVDTGLFTDFKDVTAHIAGMESTRTLDLVM